MRNFVIIALALALGAPLAASITNDAPTEPARYIVALVGAPTQHAGDDYHGATVVQVIDGLDMLVVETGAPALFEARVQLDDGVRYVTQDDPMAAVLTFTPNDARYNDAGHYGSKKIGAETAWDRTLGSTSVKVQVLDSGIYRAHEDLQGGRVLQGYDFVNNDNDPNDQGSACSYHGTHTAGTSGATIHNGLGIAGLSQHTILPTKAFYTYFIYCTSSTTALVNSLKYGGDQGAHISSNSWGMSAADPAVTDALVYAAGKGTVHVAAAGNSGACTNCVSYPWKDRPDLTIVVSASDSNDAFASFSSEGPEVDLAAPGVDILSLGGGVSTYATMSGTSMAAPHVAGVAALLKALQPTWGRADIENRLKSTAVDLGPAGNDVRFGAGRVDAAAATNLGPAPPAACADGLDNDGDGAVDYPADTGCTSATDGDETNPPPATAPSAPQSLSAAHQGNAKSGKIALNWAAPASDGGSAITGYRIYRGTSAGAETYLTTVGNVLTYTDTGLTKGVTYHYKVSAMNAVGESALSNGASAIG